MELILFAAAGIVLVGLTIAVVVKWVWFVRLRHREPPALPMDDPTRLESLRALAAADYRPRRHREDEL
jgi:hypothetical protein